MWQAEGCATRTAEGGRIRLLRRWPTRFVQRASRQSWAISRYGEYGAKSPVEAEHKRQVRNGFLRPPAMGRCAASQRDARVLPRRAPSGVTQRNFRSSAPLSGAASDINLSSASRVSTCAARTSAELSATNINLLSGIVGSRPTNSAGHTLCGHVPRQGATRPANA
jgi:hypothetical protein